MFNVLRKIHWILLFALCVALPSLSLSLSHDSQICEECCEVLCIRAFNGNHTLWHLLCVRNSAHKYASHTHGAHTACTDNNKMAENKMKTEKRMFRAK